YFRSLCLWVVESLAIRAGSATVALSEAWGVGGAHVGIRHSGAGHMYASRSCRSRRYEAG
ncbi:hypothetical protein IscW_ISCW016473, partial [Ixodes scapularis]